MVGNPVCIINRSIQLTCAVLLMVFLSACDVQKHRHTLSIFFDGVPQEETVAKTKRIAGEPEALPLLQKTASEQAPPASKHVAQIRSAHPDFRDKKCEKCHDVDHGYRLNYGQPELCHTCHKQFEKKFARLHGPVAAGFCLACHDPHQSKNNRLLKMDARHLCVHCHEPGDVAQNEAHRQISETTCLKCHNAHGGKDLHFLKAGIKP